MIVGICGLQGTGKDTIGSILVNKYGFKKLSYASALKDIISLIFGWDREMMEGTTVESRKWREQVDKWWALRLNIPNLTPRYVLQYFGTDLFRNHFHNEIWVAVVEKQLTQYKNIVITDCRFPNEISILKKYNGFLIKVSRGIMPKWYTDYNNNLITSSTLENLNIHPSEYSWINQEFKYEVINDGSIEDLEEKIFNIIKIEN